MFQGGRIMLVLGRKPGEYVMIGDKIKVTVIKSDYGNLRLAIEAPQDVEITRGEIVAELEIINKTQKRKI
jgi:carbon storage regulator